MSAMNQHATPACGGIDATRSLAYAALAAAFAYPDGEGLDVIRSGALANALRQLLTPLYPELAADANWDALRETGPDDDALQVDFTRLFDAGDEGPQCPLNGSHYGTGTLETVEEAVRFYNFFGLSLSAERTEDPDHLTTELEFLHFLAYQEAQLVEAGEDAVGLQRAQRDFIVRHPGAWVPAMRKQLLARQPMRFFPELVRLLESFLKAEELRLTHQISAAWESPGSDRDNEANPLQ